MSETGMNLALGTLEEGKAMIGYTTAVSFNEVEVNWPMIKFYCSALEDANPSYWDQNYATDKYGDIVSPPGMMMVWGMKMDFNPLGAGTSPMAAMDLKLPGQSVINVGTETEFFRPVKVGEVLNAVDEVISISDEKTTKLGVGSFVVTKATYRNGTGEVVASNTNTMFRFNPHE